MWSIRFHTEVSIIYVERTTCLSISYAFQRNEEVYESVEGFPTTSKSLVTTACLCYVTSKRPSCRWSDSGT
jgi:hypothetical protein